MSRISLAWLLPVSYRIDAFTESEIAVFYRNAVGKHIIDDRDAEAQLRKALTHKTDFVTALKISVPVNWRSSISYTLWNKEGRKPGFSTVVKTLRDRRMYELATTFAIALKSGDIRDEAFDEKDQLEPEEYDFKIRVADNLEKLVNERVRKMHREGFAEKYFKGREEIFNYELKDLKYSELFRKGEYERILSLYDDLKETWHGKTAGIGERVVWLTLFEAGLMDKEPEACEAIIRYLWAVTNVWMWGDEISDLLGNIKEGSINMLVVECLKRGLDEVDEASVLSFIARNASVLDEPVREYLDLADEAGKKLELYPWINLRDYLEGIKVVIKKFNDRKNGLLRRANKLP
ncbi:MAG: hypothetical protein ACUVQY_07365 [Thermoproteota archaeon]